MKKLKFFITSVTLSMALFVSAGTTAQTLAGPDSSCSVSVRCYSFWGDYTGDISCSGTSCERNFRQGFVKCNGNRTEC